MPGIFTRLNRINKERLVRKIHNLVIKYYIFKNNNFTIITN
jgi:hypothetical protein